MTSTLMAFSSDQTKPSLSARAEGLFLKNLLSSQLFYSYKHTDKV